LEELQASGVREIWIERDDLIIYQKLCKNFVNLCFSSKTDWDFTKRAKLLNHYLGLCFEEIKLFGLNNKTYKRASGAITNIYDLLSEEREDTNILRAIRRPIKTPYSTAVITTYYTCVITKILKWKSAKNIQNIMHGAFFQNVGYLHPSFNIDTRDIESLSNKELEEFQKHPILGFEMLKEIPHIEEEILRIVIEHHEDGTRNGFPNKLKKNKVSNLSKQVMVITKFVEEMFNLDDDEYNTKAITRLLDNLKLESLEYSTVLALRVIHSTNTFSDSIKQFQLQFDNSKGLLK